MAADTYGEPEALLDRLSARADISELDTLELPDDWRADQARDPKQCCATCHWNGRWAELVKLHQLSAEQVQKVIDLIGVSAGQFRGLAVRDRIDEFLQYKEAQLSRSECYRSRPSSPGEGLLPHELQKSASAGNLCCAIFIALWRKFDVKGDNSWLKEGRVHIQPPQGLIIGHISTRVDDIYISCHTPPSQAPPGATVYPNGGHKSVDPRSEESLTWAKSHIDECVNTHNCDSFRSTKEIFPTRLIYIPKDAHNSGVRLIRDAANLPKDAQYAALSHCWGNVAPSCLTTVDNIDKHATEGIPWAKIPRTFQHAILYARRLDLEYIWIDSLCIIQKNEEDWKHQCTRMFQYYSNAYITLASTFSTDCNGGFFNERHINAGRLHLLDVQFRGQRYPVYASRYFPVLHSLDFLENNKSLERLGRSFQLLRRAWVYQERLVSPRLLFFSEKKLIFECYGGRCGQEARATTFGTPKWRYGASLSNTAGLTAEWSWRELLSAFGTLQISYAKDKLPAISAVARQFLSHQKLPHTPEHEYLCGLRRSHLHIDLMWTARSSYDRKVDPELYWRGETYLAPTWSWASVPRETGCDDSTLPKGEKKSTITLTKEHLTFAGADRFGRVLGGYITIEGPACDVRWGSPFHLESVDPWYHMSHGFRLGVPGAQWCNINFWLDVTNVHPRVGKLVMLQTWVSVDGMRVGFLVLYRNSANGRYRRLGAGMNSSYKIGRPSDLKVVFEEAGRRRLDVE